MFSFFFDVISNRNDAFSSRFSYQPFAWQFILCHLGNTLVFTIDQDGIISNTLVFTIDQDGIISNVFGYSLVKLEVLLSKQRFH